MVVISLNNEFQAGDVVRTLRQSRGFLNSSPGRNGEDPPAKNNLALVHSQATFKVSIVSTYRGKQRLLFPNMDGWFPAEDFMIVKRPDPAPKPVPICIHCRYPEDRHSGNGYCIRAGYSGNKFDPAPEPEWTPPVNKLLEAGVERVDLNNLHRGQWLLVAVEFSDKQGDNLVCFSQLPNSRAYDIFKVNPEAVMGQVEQPDWVKPPLPDEPPIWTVVKTVGPSGPGGPITIHVRTRAAWVDLSGNRREWPEVCSLDHQGKPTVLKPEEDEMGMFD